MLTKYILAALRRAKYEVLDDGRYYGEIPGCRGVWATAKSLEVCRRNLQEVLEEWLVLKLRDGDAVPTLGGLKIRPRRRAASE